MQYAARTKLLVVLVPAAFVATPTPAAEDDRSSNEDVMRPTKLGLRLTPRLARGITRNWILELSGAGMHGMGADDKINLSDEQKAQLTDAAARRMMQLAHRIGKEGQELAESFIEASIVSGKERYTPERARELAKRTAPMIPVMREFLKGVAEDGRRVLTPEQSEQLQQKLGKTEGMVDRLDERIKRWEKGEVEEGETLFDNLEEPKGEIDDGQNKEEKERKQALRSAQWTAQWEIRRLGPSDWSRYMAIAAYFFEFDDQQTAEAEKILADYRQRAEAIMTDEWTEKVRRNRIRYHLLRWRLNDLRDGPWEYQLEREFAEAVGPLKEMGLSFRRAIIALVTDEQREAALAKIREAVAKHGMTFEPADARILGLAKE